MTTLVRQTRRLAWPVGGALVIATGLAGPHLAGHRPAGPGGLALHAPRVFLAMHETLWAGLGAFATNSGTLCQAEFARAPEAAPTPAVGEPMERVTRMPNDGKGA